MEDQTILELKSKVKFTQIKHKKLLLEQEIEENKKKTLELRRNLDQIKSRQGIKSLIFKKQLEESRKSLQETKIVWASELQRLYNSIEQQKTFALQKKYSNEKLYEQICEKLSIATLILFRENSSNFNNAYKKPILEDSLSLENGNEKDIHKSHLKICRSIDVIRDKIKKHYETKITNLDLPLPDESVEVSYETDIQISVNDFCEEEISLKQPEEEQIEDVGGEGFRATTMGDQVFTKKNAEISYIVRGDNEGIEDTLDYTKNEITIKKRNWKYWVCPCMFKSK
jgi:hypothetical protein